MNYFEIASSNDIVALATFEREVHSYNLNDKSNIIKFKTNYEFGGSRLAINKDSSLLFTASYLKGIEGFDILTGKKMYKNTSLKQIHKIEFLNKNELYVLTEKKVLHIINISDNKIEEILDNVTDFYTSLEVAYILKDNAIFKLKNEDFLIRTPTDLSCFYIHQDTLFIAERYLQITKLNENATIWISDLPIGFTTQAMKVYQNNLYVICSFLYSTKKSFYLSCINLESGKVIENIELDKKYHSFCFTKNGLLICSNGDIINLLTNDLK